MAGQAARKLVMGVIQEKKHRHKRVRAALLQAAKEFSIEMGKGMEFQIITRVLKWYEHGSTTDSSFFDHLFAGFPCNISKEEAVAEIMMGIPLDKKEWQKSS
jgi:hypothetical protein